MLLYIRLYKQTPAFGVVCLPCVGLGRLRLPLGRASAVIRLGWLRATVRRASPTHWYVGGFAAPSGASSPSDRLRQSLFVLQWRFAPPTNGAAPLPICGGLRLPPLCGWQRRPHVRFDLATLSKHDSFPRWTYTENLVRIGSAIKKP